MSRSAAKQALLRISVEEENLASIPFAVLESRVGKHVGKLEIQGTKILPDGQEMRVSWQVQGNADLGLPTEQDLDIFVALGVLTFRNEFTKTVSFTGREIAKILGISGVHGKFYQRLKLAMDRFISLRFRAIAETDRQEEVKWLNIFQEASFTFDRSTGRCTGTVTWTDKLIQSMNRGFFRVLDAGRYMELDGITVKHLYRFLAVAFEKKDIVVIDARKLCEQHLGMLRLPKYFSRLLQTLEPAFDQLVRVEVLGSYHVTNSDAWEVSLRRHANYVPERKSLLLREDRQEPDSLRERARRSLEEATLPSTLAGDCVSAVEDMPGLQQVERAGRLLRELMHIGVMPHVATSLIQKCLDEGVNTEAGRDQLDWYEIALDTCQQKMDSNQKLKNPAGLVLHIARDADARAKLVGDAKAAMAKKMFRQREHRQFVEHYQAEQRRLVVEYEDFRNNLARSLFDEMSEPVKQKLRGEKAEMLQQQSRWERMDARTRERELDELVCHEIAQTEVPPFEKWLLRKRASQAAFPFGYPAADEKVANR